MTHQFEKPPALKRRQALDRASDELISVSGSSDVPPNPTQADYKSPDDKPYPYTADKDPRTGKFRLKSTRRFELKKPERFREVGEEVDAMAVSSRRETKTRGYDSRLRSAGSVNMTDPEMFRKTGDWFHTKTGKIIRWTVVIGLTVLLAIFGKTIWDISIIVFCFTALLFLVIIVSAIQLDGMGESAVKWLTERWGGGGLGPFG